MPIVEKLIDKRLIDRNLRKGLINPEQYQALLDELTDCSHNVLTAADENCEHMNAEGETPIAIPESSALNITDFQQSSP